jgi:hypothetical protein
MGVLGGRQLHQGSSGVFRGQDPAEFGEVLLRGDAPHGGVRADRRAPYLGSRRGPRQDRDVGDAEASTV